MPEYIRYAWGHSSLGDFLAAISARGVVAFEFAERGTAAIDLLRQRCPDATVGEDSVGLSDTLLRLAAVVEHPGDDPGLPLDPRGSAHERRVWDALRRIPAGQTTSYGDIATSLGTPHEAREVAEACAANAIAVLIPCHRVVKKDGTLSGYRWGVRRKRALLTREQAAAGFRLEQCA
jgi:AraC family transcriptional regulator, regulatory protein of adaptative response / methylated-DNA-[protein]-cysteine methyltransferase